MKQIWLLSPLEITAINQGEPFTVVVGTSEITLQAEKPRRTKKESARSKTFLSFGKGCKRCGITQWRNHQQKAAHTRHGHFQQKAVKDER